MIPGSPPFLISHFPEILLAGLGNGAGRSGQLCPKAPADIASPEADGPGRFRSCPLQDTGANPLNTPSFPEPPSGFSRSNAPVDFLSSPCAVMRYAGDCVFFPRVSATARADRTDSHLGFRLTTAPGNGVHPTGGRCRLGKIWGAVLRTAKRVKSGVLPGPVGAGPGASREKQSHP